jgi:hypothetical protein
VAETDRIQIGDYLLELKMDRAAAGATNGSASGPFDEQRTLPMDRAEATSVPTQPMPPAPTVPTGPPPGMIPAPAAAGSAPPLPKTLDPNTPAMTIAEDPTKPNPVRADAASAASDAPSRLVCLSSNFAGKEFLLDKPAIVIGRTDDNDVVVNHRSISRHHAKVVREHGRYAIVDLQSSNGVRVNGEEYGKVELRRGDLIDLGHVRLRFVEAGEDFVFSRDATVVDLAAEAAGRSRWPMWVALVVLLVGIGGVVFVMQGGGAKGGPTPAAGNEPTPTPAVATASDAAPEAQITPPGPSAGAEVVAKLDDAKKAVQAEDWSSALAAANEALRLEPGNAEATRIAEQARRESGAQTVYDDVKKSLDAGKVEDAARLVQKLPDDSVYKVRAQAELEQPLEKWVAEAKRGADAFADQGKCDKIAPIAKKVAEVAPQSVEVIDAVQQRCVASTAPRDPRPRDPTPKDPTPKDPTPKDPTPKDPTPPVAVDPAKVEALYAEARKAYNEGQFGLAMRKAEETLALDPSHQGAAQAGGAAACKAKDATRARRFAARLSASRKNMLKNVCQEVGVEL